MRAHRYRLDDSWSGPTVEDDETVVYVNDHDDHAVVIGDICEEEWLKLDTGTVSLEDAR